MVRLQAREPAREAAAAGPFALRSLPGEDLFLFSKPINNARIVRASEGSGGKCWTAIAAGAAAVGLLTVALAPAVGVVRSGYRIEELKAEQQRLVYERKALELDEARLLRPDHMQQLATDHKLKEPDASQVVHLEGKPEGALARNLH